MWKKFGMVEVRRERKNAYCRLISASVCFIWIVCKKIDAYINNGAIYLPSSTRKMVHDTWHKTMILFATTTKNAPNFPENQYHVILQRLLQLQLRRSLLRMLFGASSWDILSLKQCFALDLLREWNYELWEKNKHCLNAGSLGNCAYAGSTDVHRLLKSKTQSFFSLLHSATTLNAQ